MAKNLGRENPVSALLSQLDFQPEAVVTEAARQGVLFMQAAEYRVAKLRASVRAKNVLEAARTDVSLRLRQEARDSGDRLTEENLKSLTRMDKRVTAAQEKADVAEEEEEYAKLLLEAFRTRSAMLRVVGDLAGAGLAAQKAGSLAAEAMEGVQDRLRKKYPGQVY